MVDRYTAHRDQFLERPLPSNTEGERAVLGTILLNNLLIVQALERLTPDDFYSPFHRAVFAAMVALFDRGSKIDPILIGEELKKEGKLESYGGVAAIANLTYGLPHFDNIYHYVKLVEDKALGRALIKACNTSVSEALAEEDDSRLVLDRHSQLVTALALKGERGEGFRTVADAAETVLLRAQQNAQNHTGLTGVPTGFRDFDAMTAGLQKQDLIIVAARPSVGKTSFMLTMALNAVHHDPETVVGIFSLEMSTEALVARLLCSEARVDAHRFRTGFLSRGEWERLGDALGFLSATKIFIDDTPGQSVLQMKAKARALKLREKRLDLKLVDYLQLAHSESKTIRSETEMVQAVSRELKQAAKELDVPLVALSQLSRASEQRSNHKPQLSDLRQSGSIEQDADVVAFIHRESMYHLTDENDGQATIILSKQRNGPTGEIQLAFIKELTRFENLYRADWE